MTGAELIAAERERQINQEGYDASHDMEHDWDVLNSAAMAYLISAHRGNPERAYWPWLEGFKPTGPEEPLKDLVRAGALIAAAIDRLQAK